MSTKPSNKRWAAFDFCDENVVPKKKSKASVKAKKSKQIIDLTDDCSAYNDENHSDISKKLANFNFLAKIEPVLKEDLAVHAKKITDVENWLKDNLVAPISKKSVPMLLITGPTGSGKTATIKVLCKCLNLDIQEWINPIDRDYDLFKGPGQTTRFLDFLLDAKFPSLFNKVSVKKKLTLVEDFPNILLNKPEEFNNILENVVNNGRSCIIFICTDVSAQSLNIAKNLFTEDVRTKYNICNISFNAASITLIKAALNRAQTIIKDNLDIFKKPNLSIIDAIASTTMGDIRCSINQYYFACLKGCKELPLQPLIKKEQPLSKRKRVNKDNTIKSMGKDEQLGLFHGLGRILNPKRIEDGNKWRLSCELQPLIDEFSTQPSIICGFLHQNYMNYFGDLEELCLSAEALSLGQVFLEKWDENNGTMIFALWVSVMSLMVFNFHRCAKWNPIKGPKKITKVIKNNANVYTRNLAVSDYSYYNLIKKNNEFKTLEYKIITDK